MIGRNASWVVAQVVVSTIVLFVVYYVLVRAVGIDQIGLLAIVSTMAVAARLSELGLSGAATRFVAEHLAHDERAEAGQVVVTAAVALGLSGGVGVFLVWPVLQAILPFIIDERLVRSTHVLLPATLFALWMNIVSGCLLMSLDGVHRADRRAQITVLSQGVFAVAAIVMIRPLGIVAIPVGQAAQAMCVFLLATLVLGRELPETKSARPTIACFKRIWRYGAELQLITLLILFYDLLTKLLLNHLWYAQRRWLFRHGEPSDRPDPQRHRKCEPGDGAALRYVERHQSGNVGGHCSCKFPASDNLLLGCVLPVVCVVVPDQ